MALEPWVLSMLEQLAAGNGDQPDPPDAAAPPCVSVPARRLIVELHADDPARPVELGASAAEALALVARHALDLQRLLEDSRRENRELRDLAHCDDLTGLANRRGFRERLEFTMSYAGRYGGAVSVLVADLDGLKQVNDSRGHPTGDEALRHFGQLLRASVRNTDFAARIGGDEFGVVMPHTDCDSAAIVAERIRRCAERLDLGAPCAMSASIGLATAVPSPHGEMLEPKLLFAEADAALYAAKRGGRNRVAIAAARRVAA